MSGHYTEGHTRCTEVDCDFAENARSKILCADCRNSPSAPDRFAVVSAFNVTRTHTQSILEECQAPDSL